MQEVLRDNSGEITRETYYIGKQKVTIIMHRVKTRRISGIDDVESVYERSSWNGYSTTGKEERESNTLLEWNLYARI